MKVSYYIVTFVITAGIVISHYHIKEYRQILLLIIIISVLALIVMYSWSWEYTLVDMYKSEIFKKKMLIHLVSLSITLYFIILFE